MKSEEYLKELIASKDKGEFTGKLEMGCIGAINRFFDKYPYKEQKWFKPDHEFDFKLEALDHCKKLALNFNPERSDNAFAYIVQIIKCSFASTYGRLAKEYKNRL